MPFEIRDLLRVHACALSGHDLDTFATHATPNTACFCDGEWVGEGPDAVRRLLEAEYARHGDVVGRVEHGPSGPFITEFTPEGERRGIVRIHGGGAGGRIREVRVEHGAGPVVRVGVPEPAV